MPSPHGRFKPAVFGVALILAGLCLGGTSCPIQGPLYVEDFCWTSFEGMPADNQSPLRLGQFELKNLTEQELGVYLQPLEFPLTYGENNNAFVLPPKSRRLVDVWTLESPSQALIDDFHCFRGSALRFGSYHVDEAKFLKSGVHGGASAFKVPVMGTLRPNSVLDAVRDLGDTLVMPTYGEMFARDAYGLKVGVKRPNSNPQVIRRRPAGFIDEMAFIKAGVTFEPELRFDDNTKGGGVPFPCGEGANGFTVCPSMPAALPTGETDYYLVFQVLDADIPLDSADTFLTYSAVFESDDDDSNDWVPLRQFYFDFFRGTDLWYQAQYNPGTGLWTLTATRVTDAENNVAVETTTAARAIISGNTICFAIPQSEIAAPVPEFRITAFAHTGDFGQNAPFDYSSDFAPGIFDLTPID